jgi:hypothetical protein
MGLVLSSLSGNSQCALFASIDAALPTKVVADLFGYG